MHWILIQYILITIIIIERLKQITAWENREKTQENTRYLRSSSQNLRATAIKIQRIICCLVVSTVSVLQAIIMKFRNYGHPKMQLGARIDKSFKFVE